ncbi:hypothetical protein HK104_010180 [Borealophlyctis nickersoniae]|nr:hypothetical protein HK104_010180 [Borealophlyctis nickersoniae]
MIMEHSVLVYDEWTPREIARTIDGSRYLTKCDGNGKMPDVDDAWEVYESAIGEVCSLQRVYCPKLAPNRPHVGSAVLTHEELPEVYVDTKVEGDMVTMKLVRPGGLTDPEEDSIVMNTDEFLDVVLERSASDERMIKMLRDRSGASKKVYVCFERWGDDWRWEERFTSDLGSFEGVAVEVEKNHIRGNADGSDRMLMRYTATIDKIDLPRRIARTFRECLATCERTTSDVPWSVYERVLKRLSDPPEPLFGSEPREAYAVETLEDPERTPEVRIVLWMDGDDVRMGLRAPRGCGFGAIGDSMIRTNLHGLLDAVLDGGPLLPRMSNLARKATEWEEMCTQRNWIGRS